MATNDSKRPVRNQAAKGGFRISNGPVIPHSTDERAGGVLDYSQLPKNYGAPILFAIPRDPQTIFTYWNVDWSNIFSRNVPVDQQVYLRLKRADGSDELEEPVEPMLGSHYLMATHPRGAYQVELGFYQPPDAWNSIASSELVTMPPATASESGSIDVATVPFHLSFQRMIDLFRAENGGGIASVLSQLQKRAAQPDGESLTPEEREILQAMDVSISQLALGQRSFADRASDEQLRRRAEALLGFGATSPTGGFGGSS